MNADQARQVLLVRAVEDDPRRGPTEAVPSTPIWSAPDAEWADAQALRQVGERGSDEAFLTTRAALAAERVASRHPAMAALQRGPSRHGGPVIATGLLVLALLAGLATDALGPAQRVNLLAPPLLALMLWNLAVYAGLLVHGGWRLVRPDDPRASPGWFTTSASALMRRLSAEHLRADAPPAAHRFAADWLVANQSIHLARLAALLHLAALAVAVGALLALYARGLVFEFKAGWDSTFLDAGAVHRWLSIVLAPARALGAQPLPDAAHLETLRFANGGGENAARWIHWYAITTGIVMLPRAVLAITAWLRAQRLRQGFPLPLDEPYFTRLLQRRARASGDVARVVAVLPYGHRLAAGRAAALAAAIDADLGPGLQPRVLDNTETGAEDDLPDDWPVSALRGAADLFTVSPLFALSATPEHETHGAFLRTVQQRLATLPGQPSCRVMVDESGFRQRLTAADLPRRLADRRAAWQRLLDDAGAGPAWFVDLGAPPPTTP